MKDQLQIGFDAKRAFRNSTGLGNYSRNLLRALAQYYPQHQYHLYTPDAGGNLFAPDGKNFTIHTPQAVADKLVTSFWRSARLGRHIKAAGLDIYHGLSHELPRDIHLSGVKSVVTMHDLIFMRYPQLYPWFDRKIYDRKFRFAAQTADRIVAISQQTKNDLVELFGTPEEKIEVVYQSCSPEYFETVSAEKIQVIRNKYKLPERFVLYVGSFTARKQVLHLCKAFEQLADPDTHLVLVGNGGEQLPQIKEYTQKGAARKRTHLVLGAPNTDLPAIYQMASLFVYPSLFEGFGIPIIEALASGTPVITTQGGCFPEAGGPGTAYVPATDTDALTAEMSDILTNTGRSTGMIISGKEHVQKFTPEKFSEGMMRVYEGLG